MSMGLQGFGAEGDFIASRFNTQWNSRTEISWPNVNFTPPDSAAWVRLKVRRAPTAEQASIGSSPMHRHDGTVVIEIFVPTNVGEDTIDGHCDAAADIFRDYSAQEGVRFRTPYVVDAGVVNGWYKKDVLVPFVRDTVFA